MLVSTRILMNALQYYAGKGFAPIDVPMIVDLDVSGYTKPKGVPDLYHGVVNGEHKCYQASAEQSFIQLHKEGKLSDGKYMAVTPCYRHERYLDDTHYLMFMKLELIVVGVSMEDKEAVLHEVTEMCQDFFVSQGKECSTQWNLYIDDSIDIYS